MCATGFAPGLLEPPATGDVGGNGEQQHYYRKYGVVTANDYSIPGDIQKEAIAFLLGYMAEAATVYLETGRATLICVDDESGGKRYSVDLPDGMRLTYLPGTSALELSGDRVGLIASQHSAFDFLSEYVTRLPDINTNYALQRYACKLGEDARSMLEATQEAPAL